jgi:hypothetical protein
MGNNPDPRFRIPRLWSNKELRKVAHLFSGDIANVSGGDDVDKEGLHYRDYFTEARSYTVTNYGGASFRGFQNRPQEVMLDLTQTLPDDLRRKFDVVFNHTTLEHIFDAFTAFHNICEMSRDIVIIVVPFCQTQHEGEGYLDYWRFTPTCVRKMFEKENIDVVYENANTINESSIYLFYVGTRRYEYWKQQMPNSYPLVNIGEWIGKNSKPHGYNLLFRCINKMSSFFYGDKK